MFSDTTPKHKVFISFHHADQEDKENLEKQWGTEFDGFVSKSVKDGDIDPNKKTETTRQIIRDDFIADATVTIVLIGQGTWRRKHVDWEIASSIRDTKNNSRTGLIGILLPSYLTSWTYSSDLKNTQNSGLYNPYTIPPRLHDNIESGFAKIYSWPTDPSELKKWIHEAYLKRDKQSCLPDNSRESFSQNRPDNQAQWTN